MMYKGINILVTEQNTKLIRKIKKVIDNFISGKKRSECAIIDSFLRVESNNLKLYKTVFATIHEIDHYNYICYTNNGYVVTNLNNEVVYIHPNKYIVPTTNIESNEFIDYTAPTKQILSNDEIMELSNMKKYLIELENLGQEK